MRESSCCDIDAKGRIDILYGGCALHCDHHWATRRNLLQQLSFHSLRHPMTAPKVYGVPHAFCTGHVLSAEARPSFPRKPPGEANGGEDDGEIKALN